MISCAKCFNLVPTPGPFETLTEHAEWHRRHENPTPEEKAADEAARATAEREWVLDEPRFSLRQIQASFDEACEDHPAHRPCMKFRSLFMEWLLEPSREPTRTPGKWEDSA